MDITQHLTNVIKDEITMHKRLGEFPGYNITQTGQVTEDGLAIAWLLTLSLKNPLVGQPDLALAVPIPAVVPTDEMVRQVVAQVMPKLYEEKDKAVATPKGLLQKL